MAKSNFTPAQRVLKNYENRSRDALRLVGEYVAGQAKLLCVVDTGMLRGSITYALTDFVSKVDTTTNQHQKRKTLKPNTVKQENAVSKPKNKLTVRIGTNVEYAPTIEFGAKGRSRKSFLRLSLAYSRQAIKKIMAHV